MLLLIVYNQGFLLYCVLKKLNCDDFVLFLLLLLLWLLLVAFFEKSNGEKKIPSVLLFPVEYIP